MNYKIKDNVYKKCFVPFDIVTDKNGNVGYIKEVDINECQNEESNQLSYSCTWLVTRGAHPKSAWWDHDDLIKHCNLIESIAKEMCNPFGSGNQALKLIKENKKTG